MTVPWTGFPLSQLVKLADPLGSAKYVVFDTVEEPKSCPGWIAVLSLAVHRGADDRGGRERPGVHLHRHVRQALPPQDGGPIRLTLPWKYGFKSAKAFVKITFTDKRPIDLGTITPASMASGPT